MATMRAIVQHKYGSPEVLSLQTVDRPQPGPDEVLVRVVAASLNPFDLHMISGLPLLVRTQAGLLKPKNKTPGADFAGRIEAVGSDVTDFKPGDEVFGENRQTFAEYAAVPVKALALKPANLTFEQAAAIPLAGLTALQGLRKGGVSKGQTVLVNGASGGVGTFAVQIAKAWGADVVGVCSTRNLDMVRSIGADRVVDYSNEDFTRNGEAYDVMFDLAANRSMSDYKRALRPGGIYVAGGSRKGRVPGTGPIAWVLRILVASKFGGKRMTFFSAKVQAEDLVELKELAESGKLVPVIDRRCDLSDTPDALMHLAEGHAQGKTVIAI